MKKGTCLKTIHKLFYILQQNCQGDQKRGYRRSVSNTCNVKVKGLRVCGPLLKTLTLFKTKICDFPEQPYLRPDQKFYTLFQTSLIISYISFMLIFLSFYPSINYPGKNGSNLGLFYCLLNNQGLVQPFCAQCCPQTTFRRVDKEQ